MLKKFKDIVSEVAEPLSQGEKNFKALHIKADNRDLVPGVTDQDFLFNGRPRRMDTPTASYEKDGGEGDQSVNAYDKTLKREEVELVDEEKTAAGTKWTKLPGEKEQKVSVSVMSNGRKHVMTGAHSHVAKRLKSEHGLHMSDVKFKNAADIKEEAEAIDEKKEENQYIEVTNKHTGAKKHIEVHPTKAYAALNQYRDKNNTARIVSKKPVKEEVEEIDEVSTDLLGRYKEKAKTSDTSGMNPNKAFTRREKGPSLAGAKIAAGKSDEDSRHTLNRYKMSGGNVKVAATEEVVEIDEKTLTAAEMKKREEVVKAIKREHPGMDKSMAYAIATKTAKKVAEELQTLGPDSKIKDNKHHNSSDYMNKNKAFANQRNKVVDAMIKHDCAKHVAHEEWGVGSCIPGHHTIVETAEGEGFVSHYDVLFDHGLERDVPVEQLEVLVSESHEHARRNMKEDIDYDYEGEMARAELNAICDKARALADMMDDEMQLEAWLQSKITKAKYMIDSVFDYLMYSNRNQAGTGPTPTTTSDYNQSSAMTSNYGTFLNRMGEEVEHIEEATDEKSFAALAEPKDKVTYADKIVGAKLQAAKEKVKRKPNDSSETSDKKEEMKEELDSSIISDEEKAKLEEIMKAE